MANQGKIVSILQTLKYSDHFNYPLTLDELHSRLIRSKATRPQLVAALKQLVASKLVGRTRGYYHLPKRSSLAKQRDLYATLSLPLQNYAQSLVPVLTKISTIHAVYLTGSLAMRNTDGHDDIDLMIITRPGKLWTTRLLLTIYTTLLGLRRTRNTSNIMGKLCLNLYLTPSSLEIPSSKRTLYTAYELIQAVPLYDPDHTQPSLLAANSWITSYLPNYPIPKTKKPASFVIRYSLFEKISYTLQYLYMKPRITREYITRDAAFFHPSNPGSRVLSKIKI